MLNQDELLKTLFQYYRNSLFLRYLVERLCSFVYCFSLIMRSFHVAKTLKRNNQKVSIWKGVKSLNCKLLKQHPETIRFIRLESPVRVTAATYIRKRSACARSFCIVLLLFGLNVWKANCERMKRNKETSSINCNCKYFCYFIKFFYFIKTIFIFLYYVLCSLKLFSWSILFYIHHKFIICFAKYFIAVV